MSYVVFVAPLMPLHEPPTLQRCHWKVNVGAGLLLHVPVPVDSVWPTDATPVTMGAFVFLGAVAARAVVAGTTITAAMMVSGTADHRRRPARTRKPPPPRHDER